MKKLLALTLAMLFIGVGIASATDFTITGSYFARGTWVDNWDGTGRDAADKKNQYGVYDHELSLDANWQISPYTKVFSRFEIRDENWAAASNPTEGSYGTSTPDDNIVVEYVYGQHTLQDGKTTFRTGLMGTSSWASNFGNNGTESYRVMLIKDTDLGRFIVFTEKAQGSNENLEEDNDNDVYFAGWVTKMNDITLMPSVVYADLEENNIELLKFDFGANGTIGNVGFEAEFIYSDYDNENNALDTAVFGIYANVWTQLNAFKVGAAVAYASYDDDTNQGFDFGDDFTCVGAMILGDEAFMYNNNTFTTGADADSIEAATLLAAYVSYAATERLTLSAFLGYLDSNVDQSATGVGAVDAYTAQWDGASAWEVNVQGAYKLSDNVTYSAGAAMAQLEYGNDAADPDEAVEIFHKLAFSF